MSRPLFPRRRLSLALVAAASIAAPTLAAADPLDAYLPKSGRIEGHIMTLSVAPEDQAIDRQFRVAVQNNMDWFKKYVIGQKQGQPLPWDPRMGVTKAQYDKLQHMKPDFHPGEPVTIDVTRGADGRVSFSTKSGRAASLDKVSFPPGEKIAETPFGPLNIFNTIDQANPNAPIGVWKGAEWAKVEERGAPLPSAKIAFGKREPSGEGVMYYQVAPYGNDHTEQSLVIFYKLD